MTAADNDNGNDADDADDAIPPIPVGQETRTTIMEGLYAGAHWRGDLDGYATFVDWHERLVATTLRSRSAVTRREAGAILSRFRDEPRRSSGDLEAAMTGFAKANPVPTHPDDGRIEEGLLFECGLPDGHAAWEIFGSKAAGRYVTPFANMDDHDDWAFQHPHDRAYAVFGPDGRHVGTLVASMDDDAAEHDDLRREGHWLRLAVPAAGADGEAFVTSMRALVVRLDLDPNLHPEDFGGVLDAFGAWHPLDALPECLVVAGNLSMWRRLPPRRTTVAGLLGVDGVDEMVLDEHIRARTIFVRDARKVTVATGTPNMEALMLESVREVVLPKDFLMLRDGLTLRGCGAVDVPKVMTGDVSCSHGSLVGIGQVEGSLFTEEPGDTRIGAGAFVRGDVVGGGVSAIGRSARIAGAVDLSGEKIRKFTVGANVRIGGSIDLDFDRIQIDEGVTVGGEMILTGDVARLEDRVSAAGMHLDLDKLQVRGAPVCNGDLHVNPWDLEKAGKIVRTGSLLEVDGPAEGYDDEDGDEEEGFDEAPAGPPTGLEKILGKRTFDRRPR